MTVVEARNSSRVTVSAARLLSCNWATDWGMVVGGVVPIRFGFLHEGVHFKLSDEVCVAVKYKLLWKMSACCS